MFIHNNSSKNGRDTTASKLLTHRFSASCVGEVLQLLHFDTKLVNFLLKLVLPFILKDVMNQFFSFLLCVYCKNGHTIKLFFGVYSCSLFLFSFKVFTLIWASKQMPFRITTKNCLQFILRRRWWRWWCGHL